MGSWKLSEIFCWQMSKKVRVPLLVYSAVCRESQDGKFPGIPGFFAFPFPGNSGPGSREKESQEYAFFKHTLEEQ